MSTANDFLQKLQSATVKSTVQQKQKSRPNASAAELSKDVDGSDRTGRISSAGNHICDSDACAGKRNPMKR